MVTLRTVGAFWQDTRGVSLTEGLITFPLVILMFAAFVEFGYAMHQWNQTVKALQYGARLAAVSDPVNSNFNPVTAVESTDPLVVGTGVRPAPAGLPRIWTCEGVNCNSQLNRIVYGSAAAESCPELALGARPGMCHINPRFRKNNVVVTYERSGLGYWGRPDGAVVTIRLASQNITFDLPILGALLGLNDITIPAHPVTITSEDLRTCSTCPAP
ncbi:TadE/TadG family type IV pilus assembly protein [Ensifer sp. LC163]|uniref:TadE/TadG family type IV pilus assembly protein n=1 Tax=Ensifer sp. LC163 TaxID=1120652 RepID=UPI00081380C7|nr:TadE/TadG family type IV pilus assembly protein [Ensifer sp. LC163]OCP36127.1 pilus assembly protein TadE [Ensifer sp. LC163]